MELIKEGEERPMITAEEFVVKIKADTKEAKRQIGGLRDQIKGMSEGFKEGMGKSMASETKATKEIAKQVKKTTQAKEQSAKASKETAKSDNSSVMALGKMAAVMAVVVKLAQKLANFMKEGVSNAYQFSKATGSGFNEALDRLTSKTEAIKNAFGSIGMSFIQVMEPVLSKILDTVFDVISHLSEAIAKMFKLPYYLKANKDILKQWDKNNQTTYKLISGLDELNIFEKQDTDVSRMFEKVELDNSQSGFTGIPVIDDAIQYFIDIWNNKIKPTIDSVWNSLKGIWKNLNRTFDNFDLSWVESAFGGLVDVITTTTDIIFRAINFITGLPSFQLIKPFFEIVGHIIDIIVNRAAFITTAIDDLLRLLSGDLTGAEFIKSVNENIKKHLIDPVVSLVNKITDIVVDTADNIIVAIYNLFHPNNKAEHTRMWYDYQMAKNQKANATTGTGNESNGRVGGGRVAVGNFDAIGNWNYDVKAAGGAVISKPTLALTGEYAGAHTNPEIITPENILQENLDANNQTLISAFSQLTRQILQAIANVDMSVTIGDNVIAQSASRGNDQYYKLTGKSLFA